MTNDIRKVALATYIKSHCEPTALVELHDDHTDEVTRWGGGQFIAMAHQVGPSLWCVHVAVLLQGIPLDVCRSAVITEEIELEHVLNVLRVAIVMLG